MKRDVLVGEDCRSVYPEHCSVADERAKLLPIRETEVVSFFGG